MSDNQQDRAALVGESRLDDKVLDVLGAYHRRMDEERRAPRQEAPGRDSTGTKRNS